MKNPSSGVCSRRSSGLGGCSHWRWSPPTRCACGDTQHISISPASQGRWSCSVSPGGSGLGSGSASSLGVASAWSSSHVGSRDLDRHPEDAAHEMARRVGELAQDHLRAVHVVGIDRRERFAGDDARRDEHADVALGQAVLIRRRKDRLAHRAAQCLGANARADDHRADPYLPVVITERGAQRLDDRGSGLVILATEPAHDLASHPRVAEILERDGASQRPYAALPSVAREAVDGGPCGWLGLQMLDHAAVTR